MRPKYVKRPEMIAILGISLDLFKHIEKSPQVDANCKLTGKTLFEDYTVLDNSTTKYERVEIERVVKMWFEAQRRAIKQVVNAPLGVRV